MCLYNKGWRDETMLVLNMGFKPLSNVSLVNTFSHMVGSLFILMLTLLNLIWSHLFIFSYTPLVLGDVSANILLCGMSESLLPMPSARTFMVSSLLFKSFIHFEFILVMV